MVRAYAQLRERRMAAVQNRLGVEAFEQLRSEGRSLTLEQGLDLAHAGVFPVLDATG